MAKSPAGFDGQALAHSAKRVALYNLRGWHNLDDGSPYVRQPHGAAGQKHGVNVSCSKASLFKANPDPLPDAGGQILCVVHEIGAGYCNSQTRLDP